MAEAFPVSTIHLFAHHDREHKPLATQFDFSAYFLPITTPLSATRPYKPNKP